MTKPPSNPLTQIAKRILTRQLRPIFSFVRKFRSRALYGLYRFLPRSLRSSVPLLGKQASKYAKEKFKQYRHQQHTELELQSQPDLEQLRQQRLQLLPISNPDYWQYGCQTENPLTCIWAKEAKNSHCTKCSFPRILPQEQEIVGTRGRYKITEFLGSRGRGRIYQGIKIDNEATVTIREYLLPQRHFNREEQRHTHNAFKNQGSIELVDGRTQDFRLPLNADVISPPLQDLQQLPTITNRERCYLVTPGDRDRLMTLRSYLIERGAMTPKEVCQILNQILQSLESLHHQKFRLPTGQITSRVAHGNLNLESILISVIDPPYLEQAQFQTYLTDLALWEHLFIPPPRTPQQYTLERDLVAVGKIGFYLLRGQSLGKDGYPLSPHNRFNWLGINTQLKQYLARLLGIESPFENTFQARQALLKLEFPAAVSQKQNLPDSQPDTPQKRTYLKSLLLFPIILFLAGIIYWRGNLYREPTIANAGEPAICCIADLAGIPQGTFNYTAAKNSVWNYVWQQKNLVAKNISLRTKLADKTSQFKLKYQPRSSEAAAINTIATETADFAIVSSPTNLDSNLTAETFAYDGLTFFVAFSQDRHTQDLLSSLQGKISLEQLRQLYTGKISNWQQLGGADLPVKLYVPGSDSAIALFEQKVLGDRSQVETFRQLLNSDSLTEQPITRLPIFPMLRQILPEFENQQLGSIGFGSLTQVFNQCSAYPLALIDDRGNTVQPILQSNLKPITPQLDLCREKGSYLRDRQAFQSDRYPLTYPLSVVYPRDNSLTPAGEKFVEILKTDEVQKLLSKAGLIPLNN